SGRINQQSCDRCRGLIADEVLAHQREHHGRAENDDQSTEAVQQAAEEPFRIGWEDARAEIRDADDKQPPDPTSPGLVQRSCLAAAKRTSEAAPRQKNASDINQPKRPNRYSLILWGGLNSGSNTWSTERMARNATHKPIVKLAFVSICGSVYWLSPCCI